MSRLVRFREPPQPTLPLGHGQVHWDTLPPPVRERVLALWIQLLTQHWSQGAERLPTSTTRPALPMTGGEEGR
jgi:hypothetical protein